MRALARFWRLTFPRIWRAHLSALPAAVFLPAALTYHLLRAPAESAGAFVSGLVLCAAGAAATVPVLLRRGKGLLDSTRFHLLPIPRWKLAMFHVFLGDPLRTALALFAGLAVWIAAARMSPASVAALELVQIGGGVVLLLASARALEELGRRRGETTVYWGAVVVGMVATQELITYPLAFRDMLGPALRALPDSVLLASARPTGVELALGLGTWVAGAAVLAALARTHAAFRPEMAAGAGKSRGRGRERGELPALLSRAARKEIAFTLRTRLMRPGIALAAVVGFLAPLTGHSALIILAFVTPIALGHNLLGSELEFGAVKRYHLLEYSPLRVLAYRHAAILLVFSAALLCGWLPGLALAVMWGSSPSPAASAVAYLFGASLFLGSTVFGDRVSLSHPRLMPVRSSVLHQGILSFAAGLSLLAILIASATAVVAVLVLARFLGVTENKPAEVAGGITVVAVANLALYALRLRVRRRWPYRNYAKLLRGSAF